MPALASDARRTIIAAILSAIPGAAFDDVLARLDFGPDEVMSELSMLVCAVLVGWIFFSGIYAVLTVFVFARADGETFAHWVRQSTPGTWFGRILLVTSGGSTTVWTTNGSLIAMMTVLSLSLVPALRSSPVVIISGVAAIAASWLLNTVSFAIHYARKDASERGLYFPGEAIPAFGDYFYLAVQVATSYSSNDIATLTRPMRRAVTSQAMLSFLFNTVIIAVMVSVLLSAMK